MRGLTGQPSPEARKIQDDLIDMHRRMLSHTGAAADRTKARGKRLDSVACCINPLFEKLNSRENVNSLNGRTVIVV